jgi:hypothetical protein
MASLPTELGPYRAARRPGRVSAAGYLARRVLVAGVRSAQPTWRETPFTCGYLTVLGFGTLLLSMLDKHTQFLVLKHSSTDVVHLLRHPLFVLVTSGLWVDSIGDYLAVAVVLGITGAVLERRIGTRWAFAVFASGHVGATLVTESAVAFGVHTGVLPTSALSRLDVGASYGLAATLAAAAGLLPRKARTIGVLSAWAYLGLPLARGLDMTSWGHLIAVAIGMAWWPVLARLARRAQHADQVHRAEDDAQAFMQVSLVEPRCPGMMETWSISVRRRWRAASWSPRRHSTIRTSHAVSSCCSTTTPRELSGSS